MTVAVEVFGRGRRELHCSRSGDAPIGGVKCLGSVGVQLSVRRTFFVARLVLTADEAAVWEAGGVRSFVQARSVVAGGGLIEVSWNRLDGRGRAVVNKRED